MDTDTHDRDGGTILVLGLGFLNWLLHDEDTEEQDQIAFGGSNTPDHPSEEGSPRQDPPAGEGVRPDGVRFGAESGGDEHVDRQQSVESSSGSSDQSAAVENEPARAHANDASTTSTPEESTDASSRAAPTEHTDDTPTTDRSEEPNTAVDDRLDEIESNVERLSQTVERLDGNFDSLQSTIERIETDLERALTPEQSPVGEPRERADRSGTAEDDPQQPAQDPLGDGGASVGPSSGKQDSTPPQETPQTGKQQTASTPPAQSSAIEQTRPASQADGPDTDAMDWPPETETTEMQRVADEQRDTTEAIADVTNKVSEEMGRLADGDVDPAPSEPTATVIGNEKQADDPFPSEVESDESPAEAASVEGIDQLLESDDWAVDIDDIDLDEDIDDVVDADEREAVDPFEDSPDPEPDPDSKELATDPAHLAESTSPAQAVRTYVEEGNPEPTSVEPESAEGAFEFGKILMPDEDGGPELPELVGTDVEKPYLESLPSGYAINSLAIEWMGWLVNEGDPASAVDLVLSYEEADWLGETATDDLLAYLEGLVDVTGDLSGGTPEAYDLETHLHGLEYIKEIADDPSLTEVGTDGV